MQENQVTLFGLSNLFFVSCNSKRGGEIPKSSTLKITKTWDVNIVIINGQVDITTNYDCYRFTFLTDGTYHFNDPNPRTGSWQLLNNGYTILLDGIEQYNLIFLDANTLAFERSIPNVFSTCAAPFGHERPLKVQNRHT